MRLLTKHSLRTMHSIKSLLKGTPPRLGQDQQHRHFILPVPSELTHVNGSGLPNMVDVGDKSVTKREARARCRVVLPMQTMGSVLQFEGKKEIVGKKGPVFSTAIVAGVMGAKKTSDLIPFCHPISLDDCQVDIKFDEPHRPNEVLIDCQVKVHHKTGVEMEAMVGASVAALCIYDMCKATSHDILIKDLQLLTKSGGKRHVMREEVITSMLNPTINNVGSAISKSASSSPPSSSSSSSSAAAQINGSSSSSSYTSHSSPNNRSHHPQQQRRKATSSSAAGALFAAESEASVKKAAAALAQAHFANGLSQAYVASATTSPSGDAKEGREGGYQRKMNGSSSSSSALSSSSSSNSHRRNNGSNEKRATAEEDYLLDYSI